VESKYNLIKRRIFSSLLNIENLFHIKAIVGGTI